MGLIKDWVGGGRSLTGVRVDEGANLKQYEDYSPLCEEYSP